MASSFGSIFHYAGNIRNMKMKISLSRVSPGPGALDLDGTNILVDEVACSWREVRTRKVLPNYERPEPRMFTIAVEHTDKETTEESKKSTMDIFAYLGDLADTSENNLHNALICRIISYGGKTLVFEPPLTSNGFQLEGKLGDYVARIHIYEDSFTSLADDFAKMEIMNLPDAGVFDLSDESSVTLCYNITIETGKDFPFNAIALQWRIISQFLKNSKSSGCTGFAYPSKDDNNLWNFSYTFSITLTISMTDITIGIANPQILLEADSEDGWGKQWVAGYACLSLPLGAGRTKQRISFWRPFNPNPVSKMREFFLGSPVELNSEDFLKDGGRRMFGMHTEASGSLDITVTTLIHSRHFMAKDTLQHVKYGTRLGQIGLKTDLYWRIMKVLLEFEEARQMLLRSRKNA